MPISTDSTVTVQAELTRRHKATARTVQSLLVGVVLLSVLAFVCKRFLTPRNNPSLDIAVRISILIFGLGAIALRRTQFANLRLQDIAALRGTSGLLITLEKTTLRVAVLGAVIAVIGFVATLMTGNDFYSYGAGLVAVCVLWYCYPVRTSWEQAVRRFSPENNPDTAENAG